MATVVESLPFTIVEVELKAFLGIVGTAEDVSLKLWVGSGGKIADTYMNNDFKEKDAEGEPTDVDIDLLTEAGFEGVRLGLYELVKAFRDVDKRPHGLTAKGTNKLSESYSPLLGDKSVNRAFFTAKGHWSPFRTRLDL